MQSLSSLDFIESAIAIVLGMAALICFYKHVKSAKSPRQQSAAMGCGSCGHPVGEAQGLECPECGEDLRVAGIFPSRDEAGDTRANLLMIAIFLGMASLLFFLPQVLEWL